MSPVISSIICWIYNCLICIKEEFDMFVVEDWLEGVSVYCRLGVLPFFIVLELLDFSI